MIIPKDRIRSKHEMKAFILVSFILTSLLIGCQSRPVRDFPQQVSQTQTNNNTASELPASEANQDKPRYSNEEIFSLFINCLPGKLPNDYTTEKFNTKTKGVQYKGEGKWELSIFGSGIDKVRLPEEKVQTSDTVWNFYTIEQQTEYDLHLSAYYDEQLELCEIQSIEKYNVVTENITISERQIRAELYVFLIQAENIGLNTIVRYSVRNSSQIPIKGIKIQIYYNTLKFEKEVYKGTLIFDQTAILTLELEDEIQHSIPDEYHFFTRSGEPIYYQEKPGWDLLPDMPITTIPKSGY